MRAAMNSTEAITASFLHVTNHSHHTGNNTIDVYLNGCFDNFNTIACARSGILSVVALVTCMLCVGKVCRLHLTHHPTIHQYLIFYCAAVECVIHGVHWLMWKYEQLHFVCQYLKLVQFLLVLHLYWTVAARSLRKEVLILRSVQTMLLLAWVYFSIMVIMACVNVQPTWIECLQNYWLALSGAEFALVQLFLLAGVFITSRLNDISTLDSVRFSQKRDLWVLIIVFEVSALASLAYDIILKVFGDEDIGCSGVFLHHQEIYSPVFAVFMVLKFLLPIWTMLAVFTPVEVDPQREELLPAINVDGVYTSTFSPPRNMRGRFKALYRQTAASVSPGVSSGSSSPSPDSASPVFSPRVDHRRDLHSITEEDEQH